MHEQWTEKYRPKSLTDIVGNESSIRILKRWAESWQSGSPRYKAIVLRGEPGIGKTSAALALAADFGWDIVEMNASDNRNANSVRQVAGMGAVSQTFSGNGDFMSSTQGRRKLIILDEADNLFGREDYGGAKAIVETIRESGQPIILIVNDYYELSRKASALKSLADKVTFNRLDVRAIVAVLRRISQSEKVSVAPEILDKIADNAGGDLRAAINDLEMLVEGRLDTQIYDAGSLGKRNQVKELDRALGGMFAARTARDARDSTLDLDMTPDELEKWIEESIPSEFRNPTELTNAFDAISRADVYLGRTRITQHYALWAYAKEMMTSGVALTHRDAPRLQAGEYRFPSHFIVMSRARGLRASRESIAGKLADHFHTSKRRASDAMLPYMCVLARNDRQLLVNLVTEVELDEGDVAYLLGKDPDSKDVIEVIRLAHGGSYGIDSSDRGKKKSAGSGRSRRSSSRF